MFSGCILFGEGILSNRYFRAELELLRGLAAEFARGNPALAPFLGDGDRNDPDLERLLEAVAFQNSLLRQRLASDFPELVQTLTQLILPHYLRPVPATTIIGFTPHSSSGQSAVIPAGTEIASSPVNGTACRFRIATALEIQPLELTGAAFTGDLGGAGEIRLSLTLKGVPLSRWRPATVRLFLPGDHAGACELYLLLCRHLCGIVLAPEEGGTAALLPAGCLAPAGFGDKEALFPHPPHVFGGYRLLQEYFCLPEKFLFFELAGWDRWQGRGDGERFSVTFLLERLPCRPQRVGCESFALNAVPAANLFSRAADPIVVDHGSGRYPIRPAGLQPDHTPIFSVDRVTGYSLATARERTYLPFEIFTGNPGDEPVYHTLPAPSPPGGGNRLDLRLAFPAGMPPAGNETLTIELTCSNGSLPESLCPGDISTPLTPVPDFVAARNITPVNPGHPPPLGPDLLRRLTTHLCLNRQSLGAPGNLRALLELYALPERHDADKSSANLRRIAGLEGLATTYGERRCAGIPRREFEVDIRVRQDHFAGPGDLYLFGCVLDRFLKRYTSLNSSLRLIFHETLRGGSWRW